MTGSPGRCGGATCSAEALADAGCPSLCRSLTGALGRGRILRCLLDHNKNYLSDSWKRETLNMYKENLTPRLTT